MPSKYLTSTLLPHQGETVDFFLKRKYIGDFSQMGCVSGDTLVVVNRSGASKTIPISKLHNDLKGRKLSSSLKTRSFLGNRIGLHEISDVIYSGVKETYTVSLECGRNLRLTSDHELLTSEGYVKCQDLTLLHSVMIDRDKLPKKKQEKKNKRPTNSVYKTVFNHPYARKRGVKLQQDPRNMGLVAHHRLVAEASINNLSYEMYLEKLKNNHTDGLRFIDPEVYAVHHIDGNHSNNSPTNLLVCTHQEHAKFHAEENKANFSQGTVSYSAVVSIEPYGKEDTYDIVCKDPHRNFSANGIIIHNCGKSLSFLATVCHLLEDNPLIEAAVIAPPHLIDNWLNEVRKHTTLKASPHFLKPDPNANIHIIPYTQLSKAEEVFKRCDIIGADEGHYLKNMSSQRSNTFHNLMYKYPPKYFSYMTGTGIKNRLPDMYSPLLLWGHGPNLPKIIDKYPSFYTFCNRFTNVKETQYGNTYSGMKNVEELRQYIKPNIIAHNSSVLNLPELSESSVIVKYGENTELAKAFSEFASNTLGAEITVKRDSAVAKAYYTSEYVRDILSSDNGPVVVFSDHKKPLDIMALELSNFRVGVINGEVPTSKRQDLVDKLNRNQLDVLLCTFGAASSGYNMVGANVLVVNDPPWIPGDLDQAKKRIHRIGQDRVCRIVHVIGSKVDTLILKSLNEKSLVINKTLE